MFGIRAVVEFLTAQVTVHPLYIGDEGGDVTIPSSGVVDDVQS